MKEKTMSTLTPMPDGNWFENVDKRTHPYPGLEWLTPAMGYEDVAAALQFYSSTLSFVPIFTLPTDDGRILFARMRFRGVNFTLNDPSFEPHMHRPTTDSPATVVYYLYVDDVRASQAAMTAAGATVVCPATVEFWGDLRVRVQDPFGYLWDLAQPNTDTDTDTD
jgi:PhnB protein